MSRSLRIDLARQSLELREGEEVLARYAISSARNGPGEKQDSEMTPRGRHRICEKIGAGAPVGAVFVGREPTGEICDAAAYRDQAGRDWILTRILWLDGLEPGHNQGGDVDTRRRYIYIHGAPDAVPMGEPDSHGCIRMRNADVIALFDAVEVGTPVEIVE